jgi:uncharacterized protein (TIGR00369 family)
MFVASGHLVHGGRSIGLSEVDIRDSAGRLLAHGTSRCFIFPSLDVQPANVDELPIVEEPRYEGPDPYQAPVEGEVIPQEVWDRMDGLALMQAQIAGELPPPPCYFLTGLRLMAIEEGSTTFALPAREWLCSPLGTVQGGFIAYGMDAAMAGAVQSTLPAGTAYATLDLKVNYLRPATPSDGDLVARGRVIHRGKKVAVTTAEMLDPTGKKVAVATGSTMIVPGPWSNVAREAQALIAPD